MQAVTRTGTLTLAALAVAAFVVPVTAGAATGATDDAAAVASHKNNKLVVCISGLRGREAQIELSNSRTFRSKDNDGGCTTFRDLRSGTYRIEIDAPRGCDDASGRVRIGGGTSRISFDADCRSNRHDDDFDDDDFYVTTREDCEDNGDDVIRTINDGADSSDEDDDLVVCRED